MQFIIAILMIGFVIFFHELGHFLTAKANHITVLEFALGMGPKLFSFQKNGTVYALRLLPFGGSCSMLGEEENVSDPGSFQNKPVWRRILVVVMGPVFNFLLAFLLSLFVISFAGADPAYVTEVSPDSPAAAAGLEPGDLVLSYEKNGIANGRELYADITLKEIPTDEIHMTVRRNGRKENIVYRPETVSLYSLRFDYTSSDKGPEISRIYPDSPLRAAGIETGDIVASVNGQPVSSLEELQTYLTENPLDGSPVSLTCVHGNEEIEVNGLIPVKTDRASLGFSFNLVREKQDLLGTLKYSVGEVGYWIHVTLQSLASLVRGTFTIGDMSGPVGIVSSIGDVYETVAADGIMTLVLTMLNLMILITANLGVVNLLPFPALDGGRCVFLIIEAIRGKPAGELENRVNFAGFMLLMLFMVYITVHDVGKLL